jgi:hypothetical protein
MSDRHERAFDRRCEELCAAARAFVKAEQSGTVVISLKPLVRAAMRVSAARIRLSGSGDHIPKTIEAISLLDLDRQQT